WSHRHVRNSRYRGAIVKGTVFIAAAVIATAATVTAQDAPSRPDAPQRNQIRMMENVLTGAVRQGAESLARTMQVKEPGSLIVTGTARANGIAVAAAVNDVNETVAPEPRDPNEQYTEAVKAALVDAMLDYGLPIGADEWLIVAARDSEGPISPGVLDDASTIVLKVKGSDLLAFRAKKLTREE